MEGGPPGRRGPEIKEKRGKSLGGSRRVWALLRWGLKKSTRDVSLAPGFLVEIHVVEFSGVVRGESAGGRRFHPWLAGKGL